MQHEFVLRLWIAMMTGLACYVVLFCVVIHRLKAHHRDIWVALGCPSFLNNSVPGGFRSARYVILSDGYKSLGDAPLDRMVSLVRSLFWFEAVALICVVVLTLGRLVHGT